jgi:hypothetical protein
MSSRLVTEGDRAMLESWIQAEPSHPNNTPDFYVNPPKGIATCIYEDGNGPVIAARYTPILRIDFDFNPDASPERVKALMQAEFPNVVKQAKAQGFSELLFESTSAPLIAFCKKLGYVAGPDTYVRKI